MYQLIAHPHLLVRATIERFLPTRATFRSVLANDNHWLQPMLELIVRWWLAQVSVGGLLYNPSLKKSNSKSSMFQDNKLQAPKPQCCI